MHSETATFDIEIKSMDEASGGFEGYLAAYGNVDHGGDKFLPGAFSKAGRKRYPLLWYHNTQEPIGYFTVEREDEKGLYIKASLINEVQRAREVHALLKNKVPLALSVGFSVNPGGEEYKNGVRVISDAKLWEGSVVVFPMNERAKVMDIKKATRFRDLPIAPRERRWDARAAERRVRRWADAEDAPNERYRMAFMWYDEEAPDNFMSYKLQYADVIDGRLVAVPRAIFAIAAVLQGARGGVDIPTRDVPAVRRHVERYYEKMSAEWDEVILPPWLEEKDRQFAATLKGVAGLIETPKDFERFLRDAGFSGKFAKGIASRFKDLRDGERDVHDNDDDEIAELIEGLINTLKN